MKKLCSLACILLINYGCFSQEKLTLKEAITTTLENNFDIKLAKNDTQISSINNHIGNAGMLPSITTTITNSNSLLNTTQTQGDGTVRKLDGAKNMNLTYGVGLDWTVFDGFKMFAKKERLEALKKLGEQQLQKTILETINSVTQTYYQIALTQMQIKTIDTTILISEQRYQLAKNRYTIGKASKLEMLNAEVDWNSDKSQKILLQQQYQSEKLTLNQLMSRDLSADFFVEEKIQLDESLVLNDLIQASENQNPDIVGYVLNEKIAQLNLKETKANRYPLVRLTSGYNFSRSQASLGFITQAKNNGWVYGFNASLPIFDGFSQSRNEKIAKAQIDNAKLQTQLTKQDIQTKIRMAYLNYQSNIALSKIEKQNTEIAKQNLDITQAKFNIGTITPIEYRTAQENYINAQFRATQVLQNAILQENQLKMLAGNIKI